MAMRDHDPVDGDAAPGLSLAERFEQHRPYLQAVGIRLLGSREDAEDAVQEAWLRLSRAGEDGISDIRAWLTTVTSRIALDMLRHRRLRRDAQFAMSLDDLRGADPPDDAGTPEQDALLAESVAIALRVVLEQLTPAERVAFVLHDLFDIPFASIASLLERSTDAAKMLASRARRRLRGIADPTEATNTLDRSVVDAFFAAAKAGDTAAVLELLAPDLKASHSFAHGDAVTANREEFAGRATFGAQLGGSLCPITVDGAPGAIVMIDGRPTTVLAFETRAGMITRVQSVTDPQRLAQIVPSWIS